MKHIALLLLVVSQLISCASGRAIIRVECPVFPPMFKIQVQDGAITGKEVSHVIENHQNLWSYIHEVTRTGCTRK